MKKSFKKLGFVSLAASGVFLGSMNATDLETYAALQKPSHVFGNYAEKDKDSKLTSDSPTQQQAQTQAQNTASSGTPAPETPPIKKEESGNSVASQLVKDTTTVNNLKSVSVSGMNTTLSGVETMSKQTATISALLNSSTDLSSVISNAQGLSSAFGALESAQNTLKGYLDSSSATIG
ncbi:possible part of outer membrane protein HorA [Helicobacter pylori F32]|nr:possible part of outer membrane protein HorA [Helicobacter pylori F32]